MRRSNRYLPIVSLLLAVGNSACTRVPALDTDPNISVSQVVHRVKCELVEAVAPYLKRRQEYDWFQRWTAGVDLTLIVTEQAGMSPTVSFIHPMHPLSIPGIGTFSQNFSFGAGLGLSTTASRNETISFALNLNEIDKEALPEECALHDDRGLNSDLGLKEWVASAFDPIERGLLKKGVHKSPKGGHGGGRSLARAGESESQIRSYASPEIRALMDKLAQDLKKVAGPRAPSSTDINIATNDIDNIVQALDAKVKNDIASGVFAAEPPFVATYRRQLLAARVELKAMEKEAAQQRKLDPPVESLSHQVQFVVALSGNVSPSWTLARFRGPATSGSLASAASTRTHTLVVVLGDPGTDQAKSQRNALTVGTAIRSAVPGLGL
jgi:hypothetical protein